MIWLSKVFGDVISVGSGQVTPTPHTYADQSGRPGFLTCPEMYIHVAFAFPLVHHYRSVLARGSWASQSVNIWSPRDWYARNLGGN